MIHLSFGVMGRGEIHSPYAHQYLRQVEELSLRSEECEEELDLLLI